MKKTQIYTDGSCIPSNPGCTLGFAAVIIEDGSLKDYYFSSLGSFSGKKFTSNLAELLAIENGISIAVMLGYIEVSLITDSQYIAKCFNKIYTARKHLGIWTKIFTYSECIKVEVSWLRRGEHKYNVLADTLSRESARFGHKNVPLFL